MTQKIIKVLTLSLFISIITGFVIYRMGYFDSSTPSSALQTSPNGGELNNANQVSDSTQTLDSNRTPEIKQQNKPEIMPSSKSITPAFDLKKYEEKKAKEQRMSSSKSLILTDFNIEVDDVKEHYVHSSKSMVHPIDLRTSSNAPSEQNRQAIKVQPKLNETDSNVNDDASTYTVQKVEFQTNDRNISAQDEPATEVEKPKGVYWGMVGLGVLGILFVGIGSIVYFKKKSK